MSNAKRVIGEKNAYGIDFEGVIQIHGGLSWRT